jgi:hypothetical protein
MEIAQLVARINLCMPRREVMRNGMRLIGRRLDKHKGCPGDELRTKDIGKLAKISCK